MGFSKKNAVETAYKLVSEYNKVIKMQKTGYKVHKKWIDDFYCFYRWSVNNGYEVGKKLVLKVNDKEVGYLPINCKFVDANETKKKRARPKNRSDSVNIYYAGRTRTATEWAELMNIPKTTIYSRVKQGWPDKYVIEGKPKKGEISGNN